jgi:hypothetical protein
MAHRGRLPSRWWILQLIFTKKKNDPHESGGFLFWGEFDTIFFVFYNLTMKIKIPPILEYGIRVIAVILLLFVSVEIDHFAFGMMNVSHTVAFGLGVSLLLGGNLIIFFLCYELIQSIFSNQKQQKQ